MKERVTAAPWPCDSSFETHYVVYASYVSLALNDDDYTIALTMKILYYTLSQKFYNGKS